jgi:hypothetical protein
MTDSLDCAALRDIAPELALGLLPGAQRAAALGHLAMCGPCRDYVEELSSVADRLLLLSPEDEPPTGFESRVVARMYEARPPVRAFRSRRAVGLLTAAALVIAVLGVGAGAVAVRHADTGTMALTHEYITALQHIGGRSLRSTALVDARNQRVGQAFIYDGSPSWVFVSVDRNGNDGQYTVLCTGAQSGPLSWGGLRVADGHGSLGFAVRGDVRGLDRVQLVDTSGHAPYTGVLDHNA